MRPEQSGQSALALARRAQVAVDCVLRGAAAHPQLQQVSAGGAAALPAAPRQRVVIVDMDGKLDALQLMQVGVW